VVSLHVYVPLTSNKEDFFSATFLFVFVTSQTDYTVRLFENKTPSPFLVIFPFAASMFVSL
jgi:hypothetical protein